MTSIRTEREYRAAMLEIETLMRAEAGTPEGARLDELVTAVQEYEQQHYDITRHQ